MSEKWDKRFMEMAQFTSSWSKDPSTKCSAVIVDKNKRIVSIGFNGFPRKTYDDPNIYNNRKLKYLRIQHAERNAILFAQHDLTNCTMYVFPLPPCAQCAGMIIQAGINRVVTIKPTDDQYIRWGQDIIEAEKMFKEAEIVFEYWSEQK